MFLDDKLFKFGTYFPIGEVTYLSFLLTSCLSALMGLRSTKGDGLLEGWFIIKPEELWFLQYTLSSTECGAIIKRIVCFLLCKLYNIFACLMFYFSNSFLIVSYNCDTRFRF